MNMYYQNDQHQQYPQDIPFQYKHISFSFYFRSFLEGCRYALRFWYLTLIGVGSRKLTTESNHVTLACGFKMLSRLCSIAFLYIPCFLFDLRLGLKPTRKFIIVNQFIVSSGILLGIFLSTKVYTPILDSVITDSAPQSTRLIRLLSRVTLLAYVTFGLCCLLYLMHKTEFVYNFVLHQCANMSLPADFQNSQAAKLFLRTSTMSVFSEPIFFVATILEVFQQPEFFPTLNWFEFFVVKQVTLWTSFILTYIISAAQNLLPVCTQFLISMSEAHANELIDKLMARIKKKQATNCCSTLHDYDRSELVEIMSPKWLQFLEDISCPTILRDWPEIPPDSTNINDVSLASEVEVEVEKHHHQEILWNNSLEDHSLIVGSRIFLYKNIIKNLIELRELIRLWEKEFGSFHLLAVCVNGFLVAQWVVIGRVENRASVSMMQDGLAISNSPLLYRTLFSLFAFTISNIVIFLKCNLLPLRMEMIRQKLFKLNLDLVEPGEGTNTDQKITSLASQHEIELVWSLYDQAERVIREVNFRFTGKTYYSKRCLITIFSREASLILLYLQVIDIYSV